MNLLANCDDIHAVGLAAHDLAQTFAATNSNAETRLMVLMDLLFGQCDDPIQAEYLIRRTRDFLREFENAASVMRQPAAASLLATMKTFL